MSPADRALVRRDPRLTALGLVLDDDALTSFLADRWPADAPTLRSVRVRYLRYKPATLLLAAVVVDLEGSTRHGLVAASSPEAAAKLGKTSDYAADHPGDLPVVADPDARVLFAPVTADRHLPGCLRLTDRVGWVDRSLRGASLTVLSYKPHRRLVVRADVDGVPRAVVKVHRPGAMDEVEATLRWATSTRSDRLALPQLIGLDADAGIAINGWQEGVALDQQDPDRERATLRGIGKLLGRLHASDPAGLPERPARRPSIDTVVTAIERLRPDLAAPARRALRAAGPVPAGAPVHGDLSPDQVVHGPDGVGLIDLDRAGRGAPAADLASWVAADLVERAGGDRSATGTPLPPDALLEGYRGVDGPAQDHHVTAALPLEILRRATDPFRARTPDWERRMEFLVTTAAGLVELRSAS